MTKNDARVLAKKSRVIFQPGVIENMQHSIEKHFKSIDLPLIQYLQSYMPLDHSGEVDPSGIVRFITNLFPQVIISIPRIKDNGFMESIEMNKETILNKNQFGILEPVAGTFIEYDKIDLVLMPLLAFDLKGNRVGFGKGYYDRFLAQCRSDVLKIGLSFLEPFSEITDIDSWDIPLSYCITPKMMYAFQ